MTQQINRRQFLRGTAAGAVLLGGSTILAACGGKESEVSTAPGSPKLTPLPFQASWVNDAEFAGYFVAIDNGYYTSEGIDLAYASGGPDVIPESTLLSGTALVTLTTPETTVKAITEQGAKFKIIGAQFQKNPIGVVSLAASGINSPADLVGKTLAVPPVNTLAVRAMFRLSDIDINDINIVPYQYDPTPLIAGEVDATIDFVVNVPYTIRELGAQASSFLLYDFGFTVFNDTIVVTEETLNNQRDMLVGWLRASRKGWDENFKDVTKYPTLFEETWFAGTGRSIENELFFNDAQQSLIEHPDGIFAMSEDAIAANISALAEVGVMADRSMFDTTLLEEI
ncbi:MAG: ABC transporter substrate-binding protein [Actinobacteria bacterium]|nr:ABC transporter substrate-binding protein [Actinomycetota bacterium]